MPLSKQLFPLQFGQGIDTKTDAKLVVPGKLLELENGVFTKLGAIHKRSGFDLLSNTIAGGEATSRADGLAAFRDELLLFGDEGRVYSRSTALDGWVDRGRIVSVDLTTAPVVRNTYQQKNPDSATYGGLTVTAWEDSRGGVRYSVRDDETGTVFVDDDEINSTAVEPHVVVWQTEFVVFYRAANNIFYKRIPSTSPTTLGVEVNPISTLDAATPKWDVLPGETYLFVFGNDSSVGLAHWRLNTSFAVQSRTTIDATKATNHVTAWLATNGSDMIVARSMAGGVDICTVGTTGTVLTTVQTVLTTATDTLVATGAALSNTEGVIYASTVYLTESVRYYLSGTTFAGGTAQTVARGLRLAGEAFLYSGAVYAPCSWDSTYQAVTMVMTETGEVIAKTQPGLGGGHRDNSTVAGVTESSGVFSFPAGTKTAFVSDAGTFYGRVGVERVSVDFTSTYRYASAELGNNLLIAGGILHAYDGKNLTEAGFHFFPEGLDGNANGSGGSIDAGVHQYRVVYEWTDAQGQVHRSAPSLAFEVTTGASDSVTLDIPTLRVTSKSDVRIGIYRTVASGSVFYRVSSLTSPTLNDTTVDTVSYTDVLSDTAISSNDLIYTDGTANQELENVAPGACALIATHRGRAFAKTGPNRISYSKITFDGDPPAFNDGLYLLPDGRGGDITALAGMDDKLVVFKERAIFVVVGDGPNNAGQGDYAEPQLVTSDVGCDEPRSVVLTNAGLMFHSPKGIYLLDRSLSVTYLGAPVELFNGLTITSAAVVPNNNQVRFTTSGTVTLDNGETRTNLVLVYDYLMNQWATFTNVAAVDACVWQGRYVWASSRAKVYVENPDSYTDNGAFIPLRFVTSWLSLGQLNGFQRVYRLLILGDYKGSHSLRVRLGYDFAPEYTYDQTIDADTVTGPDTWGSGAAWGSGATWGGSFPREWFRVSPARQKCSAIRICVEDVEGTSATEGFAITGIGVLAGVKGTPNKMAASRSI